MNTISNNNKLLLLTTVGVLMLNGCVAQENFQKSSFSEPWKNISQERDDCPDCYASGTSPKKTLKFNTFQSKEHITYDYSKAKVSAPSYVDNVIDTQNYGTYDYSVTPTDTYVKKENIKVTPKSSYVNSSRDSFNTKLTSDTTIQVGAFRHYSGAKKIAKKYSLLSSQYNVKIETGMKGNTPIHRVRISGFHSKGQAKAFMSRYAINDAFLVRR